MTTGTSAIADERAHASLHKEAGLHRSLRRRSRAQQGCPYSVAHVEERRQPPSSSGLRTYAYGPPRNLFLGGLALGQLALGGRHSLAAMPPCAMTSATPPPVVSGPDNLPFLARGWEAFEAFVEELLPSRDSLTECNRFGARGQLQDGIDIVGWRNGRSIIYQTKCYSSLTSAHVQAAVVKYAGASRYQLAQSKWSKRSYGTTTDRFVLVVACSGRERRVQLELNRLRQVYAGDLEIDLYDDGDLTRAARGQGGVVRAHYGELWAVYVSGQVAASLPNAAPIQPALLSLRAQAADAAVLAGGATGPTGSGSLEATADNIHPWFTEVLGCLKEVCAPGSSATLQQLRDIEGYFVALRDSFRLRRKEEEVLWTHKKFDLQYWQAGNPGASEETYPERSAYQYVQGQVDQVRNAVTSLDNLIEIAQRLLRAESI